MERPSKLLVETDAERLRARNLAFSDVVEAVRKSNFNGNPDPWKIETEPLLLGNQTSD